MNAGWILCLTLATQVPGQTNAAQGWQPGNSWAQSQFSQPRVAQNVAPHVAQQQTSGGQIAPQQQGQVPVDQYGRPLTGGQQYAPQMQPPQQGQQQPTWQSGNTQFQGQASGGQATGTGQNQFGNIASGQQNLQQPTGTQAQQQQMSDPRLGGSQFGQPSSQNFNTQGQPYQPNVATNQQQQPNTAWQQQNSSQQPTAPSLLAPQNAPQTQHQWVAQQNANPNTFANQQSGQNQLTPSQFGGSASGQQYADSQQLGTNQQFAGQQQFGGQQQFNSPTQQPRVDVSLGDGGSRLGAHMNLGDSRITVADNSSNMQPNAIRPPNQTTNSSDGRFASQFNNTDQAQPSLVLQPPLRSTLPASNGQLGEAEPTNVNPYARVEPGRADEPASQNQVTVNDSRTSNWGDSQTAGNSAIPQNTAGAQSGGTSTSRKDGRGLPSLFGGSPTGGSSTQPAGYNQPASTGSPSNGSLFASASLGNQGGPQNSADGENPENAGDADTEYTPSNYLIFSLLANLFMIGAVAYLGWIAIESHFRYRRALVEGDDFDDDRDARRR